MYLAEVDRAEALIAVLGDEYGSQDAGGVSPTEREFDRATKLGIPRFVFVEGADDQRRQPKMAALVKKAGTQRIRRRFSSIASLKQRREVYGSAEVAEPEKVRGGAP